MIESFLRLLEAGLSLWNTHERDKYFDQVIELKGRYYDEMSKPEAERSDAVLDDIFFKLRALGDSFAASLGNENAKNQH